MYSHLGLEVVMKYQLGWLTGLCLFSAACVAEVVNVYSARHYDTDMALYENFTDFLFRSTVVSQPPPFTSFFL